jgi:methyltransferase OMS1
MRSKALLLITTATAIRPTTRRAALAAVFTPTAAVAYDSKKYDRYAGSYDDLDGGQAAKALGIAAARKALAARCAGRVLEVGAGTGLQAPFYAGNSDIKEVTFVDASRGMLDGLRAKLSNAPLPFKTEVVEADAARLPLSTGAYDCVVDTFGLCVYDQPVAVLRELGRVVKPAGRILLLENARPSNAFLGAYVDATADFVAKNGGKGCRYDQDVEALARSAGLRVVRSERFGGGFFGSFELAPAPR